jgi:hypothetical protein
MLSHPLALLTPIKMKIYVYSLHLKILQQKDLIWSIELGEIQLFTVFGLVGSLHQIDHI